MSQAPARGARKCGSCAFYTSKEDEWNKECKLDRCACKTAGKEFGIALCPNHTGKTYIDTSNHHDIGGPVTGLCEWKCPPILRKLLWGEFSNRYVNKDGSWCHCWQEQSAGSMIDSLRQIDATTLAISPPNSDTAAPLTSSHRPEGS
jgi:hypothetical protein